ncbi:MAG: diguanylate cyclase (GGDEF)-like protein/PAS domain S-box-containing protein [Motiliproteus sp.]
MEFYRYCFIHAVVQSDDIELILIQKFGRSFHTGYVYCSALLLFWVAGTALCAPQSGQPSAGMATEPPRLIVAIDDNYPPYIFRDNSGALTGYLVDLWALWQERTGVVAELKASDWGTAQSHMRARRANVIDTLFKTPERLETFEFSPAYAQIPVAVYSHNKIGGITKPSDLQGFLVGVKAGDACIHSLQQAGVSTLKTYANYETLVQAAIEGVVHTFCLDEPPANYLLYKADAAGQFRKAFELSRGEFHRAVHKGDAPTLQLINRGFAAISAAEKQALYDKWMGKPLSLSGYAHYLAYALTLAALIAVLLLLWGATLRRQVKHRTAELNAEQTRLQALLQAMPDLVWMKDCEGVFRFCNPMFERFYGTLEVDIIGKTDYDFIDQRLADTFRIQDLDALKADHPSRHEDWLSFAYNNEPILVETTKTPVRDAQGKILGILGIAHDITARKQAEQALQESESKLHTILDSIEACIYIKDCNYKYQYVNQQACELIGKPLTEITDQADSAFFDPKTAANLRINDRRVIENGERVALEEINTYIHEQRTSAFESIKLPLRHQDGTIYGLCGISTEITERKQAESSLRVAAAAFESQQGMVITDADNLILRANQAFIEMSGYPLEEIVGQSPSLFMSGGDAEELYARMWASINTNGSWEGESCDRRKNGDRYPKWLNITAVKDSEGTVSHYVATHTDITERKAAEAEILNLAFYDPLTSLPNRRLLADRLKLALPSSMRLGKEGALLFIDLDHFKTLNDTLGHDKGDLLLQQVAERICASVRKEDSVARLGGDEFVVMLESLSACSIDAANETRTIAEKILAAINKPCNLSGQEYLGSASIGITLFNFGINSSEELMKRADLAMYTAKEAGRNTLRFFDPSMQAEINARVALETDLREALRLQQFVLYYQPQLDNSGCVTGAEALIRWFHPQRGLVPPASFIPLAESSGMILPLGIWVLETACRQLTRWAAEPATATLSLAVNISAKQLHQPDFVAQVMAVLERTGASPCRLKLELTESQLLDDIEDCITKMQHLRSEGIGFALDDFGTGYSSLAYLKRLPLEQLKIDQSFVRDVLSDPNDAVIARTIVALAHSMGLTVIAEGVETAAQRDFLADNQCYAYQGYLFSRPVPIAAFNDFLLSGSSPPKHTPDTE